MASGGAEVLVYTSDSSWTAKGNRSGRKYHFDRHGDKALAVCGLFVLDNLGPSVGLPVDKVPDYMRCRRPACKRRWEQAEDHAWHGFEDDPNCVFCQEEARDAQ